MACALVLARAGVQAVCVGVTVVLLVGAYIDYLLTELASVGFNDTRYRVINSGALARPAAHTLEAGRSVLAW